VTIDKTTPVEKHFREVAPEVLERDSALLVQIHERERELTPILIITVDQYVR
jgi:hypothetical protein